MLFRSPPPIEGPAKGQQSGAQGEAGQQTLSAEDIAALEQMAIEGKDLET